MLNMKRNFSLARGKEKYHLTCNVLRCDLPVQPRKASKSLYQQTTQQDTDITQPKPRGY